MVAKIKETRCINFYPEDAWKVAEYSPSDLIIRSIITADIFTVQKEILPIIAEGHIEIEHKDKKVVLFSCIFHTKVLLSFDKKDKPINDLIKMWEDVYEQEKKEWIKITADTPLSAIDINKIVDSKEAYFNKSYQLIEIARQQKLLDE